MEELKDIMDAVVAGNIAGTKDAVRQALGKGVTPTDVIEKGMVAGLDVVGEQFAAGETFLPEMMLSAIARCISKKSLNSPMSGGVALGVT